MAETQTRTTPTPWPTHADGTPKKMGEMTRDERAAQFKDAVARVERQLESPAFRAALAKAASAARGE